MKFALRDDDLNFFYSSEEIVKNYKGIWELCPVSMSVIPFIKGDWPNNVQKAEKRGPGYINEETLRGLKADNIVYPIGDNIPLVHFIKEKIKENKIYLTLHGIYHRNEDEVTPQFSRNFGFGAEFFTTRDLSTSLKKAKEYTEITFDQRISIFTPPQNLYSANGLTAILNNNLAICGDLPSVKNLDTLNLLGIKNYINLISFKLLNKDLNYPFPIINGGFRIISHYRLQPGTDMNKLYSDFELVRNINGVFVISTHSYGFNFKMKQSTKTLGDELRRLIEYASKFEDVQFVNLSQIFE